MTTLTIELLNPKAQTILDGLADIGLIAVNQAPMEKFAEYITPAKKTPKQGGWEGEIWMANDFDAPMEEFVEPVKRVPKPGCMRGEIWMADDFDAPLEDFAEYM